MLTVNQDNFTGTAGNDTFIAGGAQDGNGNLINTLQSVDVLDGGAGTDTLKFTDADGSTVTPSMTNIEIVEARFTDDGELDLSSSTGVQQIIVAGSTDDGTVSGLGAVSNLTVRNDIAGNDVYFEDGTATALNITFENYGNVDPDNLRQGDVYVEDNDPVSAALSLTNSNVELHFEGTLTDFKTMTIAATGTNILDTAGESDDFVETLTVTGSGSIDFDGNDWTALKTLAAGDATGNLTNISVDDTATSVTFGSGDDEITYTAGPVAAARVNLGAGDDRLELQALPTAGALLDGGDGEDTIAVRSASVNTNHSAVISNFEVLEVTDALGQALNVANFDSIQNVVLAAGSGAFAISGLNSGATVTYGAANTGDSTLTVAGTAGVINVVLNAANTADFQTIIAASVGTVNVESTTTNATPSGVTNTVGLTVAAAETLNVTGNTALVIDTALTDVETINAADFDADLTVSIAGNANDVVVTIGNGDNTVTGGDGDSVITVGNGDNTINGGAGDETITVGDGDNDIAGGAGDDTIVVGSGDNSITGGFGADTITLGSGSNTVVYDVALESTGATIDIIINFKAGADGDEFDFTGVLAVEGLVGAIEFVGNFNSITAANTALGTGSTNLQIVYVAADNSLYVDVNDDGVINVGDMVIELTGMTGTLIDANFGL